METADLLSLDYIVDTIKDLPPQDKIKVVAEMRMEAKKHGFARDFNKLVDIADTELKKREFKPLKDVPACIKDYANYGISERGIFMQTLTNNVMEICPYPIFPTERYIDIDDGTEKVKLEYKRDKTWHELIEPRSVISSANKITQLADFATGINSENAKGVVRYLSDIESANRNNIGCKQAVARLGWTEKGFVPFVDDIVFTGADQYAPIYNKFHSAGSEQTWRELSIECLKFPLPKIIVAASYASLLLKQIGVNGFCVHLWGESGRGKTVALMLGASIYGDADPKSGLIRNGKTTSNGIEPVLGFFNDCAVFFDELTTLSQEQITDMIYKFAQGQGKGRMTKSAGLQRTYTWNNVAILSAEKPLVDNKTMSGAVNRVISLYTEGAVFGDMDMVDIANTLKHNYGFGAKKFIEALSHVDAVRMYQGYVNSITKSVEQKQANAAAVILTAYEIACKYVYGIDDTLQIDELVQFLASKKEVSASMRAYNEILSWVDANYTMFDDTDINQSKWGSYGKENTVVNIFYTRFVDWCQKQGYQETALLKEWRNRGLIKTRSKNELKNSAKIHGELHTNLITLILVKGEGEKDKVSVKGLEPYSEADEGQLPF